MLSISEGPRKKPFPSGALSRPSTTTVAPSAGALSTYDATRSRCSRVTSGPISAPGSSPWATFTFGIRSLIFSTRPSATSPTATIIDTAMHRSPAGLREQLGRQDRRRGILLGRLEDEGVPARERGRPHPHRNHRREVERR